MFPSPERRPRFVPKRQWPPYAFVPGRGLPHPVADPQGHLFGLHAPVVPIDPSRWRECGAYLWGVDLFNFGFYWEAHESWEGVWRSYDRGETPAVFLQGLIKLAAAGVKVREGVPDGTNSLAAGAAEHFREVRTRGDGGEVYCGLTTVELESAARRVTADAPGFAPDTDRGPRIVFELVLRPGGSAS
jgi:hypothetical protein